MGYLEIAKFAGIAVLVAAIFGGGYKTAYTIEHNKITALELAIEKANNESAALLAKETKIVADAEATARDLNTKLEKSYEENNLTINTYKQQLANTRLRDPNHKSSCPNAVSKDSNPIDNSADEGNGSDLSAELEKLLLAESYRADQAALDKNLLLKFINENNCGISK